MIVGRQIVIPKAKLHIKKDTKEKQSVINDNLHIIQGSGYTSLLMYVIYVSWISCPIINIQWYNVIKIM